VIGGTRETGRELAGNVRLIRDRAGRIAAPELAPAPPRFCHGREQDSTSRLQCSIRAGRD
jgi:hypothetical protein